MTEPRFLARASQYGYTDNPARALRDEPEALSSEEQDFVTARVHRSARAAELADFRAARERIEAELNGLYARRFHDEVRPQLRALQRQLDRIDEKLRR